MCGAIRRYSKSDTRWRGGWYFTVLKYEQTTGFTGGFDFLSDFISQNAENKPSFAVRLWIRSYLPAIFKSWLRHPNFGNLKRTHWRQSDFCRADRRRGRIFIVKLKYSRQEKAFIEKFFRIEPEKLLSPGIFCNFISWTVAAGCLLVYSLCNFGIFLWNRFFPVRVPNCSHLSYK